MAVVDYADNFQRADGPPGVTSSGGKLWLLHSGSAVISGGRLVVQGIAVTDVEVADYGASLTLTDGASLVFREVDGSNHWRWRAQTVTSSTQVPQYETEYEWSWPIIESEYRGTYRHVEHGGIGTVNSEDAFVDRLFWGSSSAVPASVSVAHKHTATNGVVANYTTSYDRTAINTTGRTRTAGTTTGWGTSTRPYDTSATGYTRTSTPPRQTLVGYSTVSSTTHHMHLERVVAGAVATVRSVQVASIGPARVVTRRDGTIQALSGTSQVAVTDPALSAATRVGGRGTVDNLVVTVLAKPPAAPTSLAPNGSEPVDASQVLRLSWQHSSPDPQVGYTLSLRPVGATAWSLLTGGAESYRDIPPGALVPGQFEWEVVTSNAVGSSPASARAFFAAAVPPSTPVITSPAGGSVTAGTYPETYPASYADAGDAPAGVGGSTHLTTWVADAQDGYQLRILADAAGQPGEVLLDTGTVLEPGTRSLQTQHQVNGRIEHLQVRVLDGGLWSGWASVRYQVTYTPPPAPTGLLDPTGPWMRVLIVNPQPTGSQPAVTGNALFRRPLGSVDEVGLRVAVDLGVNAEWLDARLAHLEDVEYRAVASGANGTVASGQWFGDVVTPPEVVGAEGFFVDADYTADYVD